MAKDLFQPRVQYTPSYNLENLVSHKELLRLRRCKIKTRNDLLRDRYDEALLDLMPSEYLSRYIDWLDGLKEFFCQAYDLCRTFPNQELSTLQNFCRVLNNRFKKHYRISTHAKRFLEKQAEYLKRYYHLDQEEVSLLYTPSIPSAQFILEMNKYKAKQGDAQARRYLIEEFYLSETYTDREIDIYEPLPSRQYHQLVRRYHLLSTRKHYLCLEKKLVQTLDEILCLDNTDELILWRIGNHRLVLIALYQKIQKKISEEDLSYRTSNREIDVDEMIRRLNRICN